MSVAVTAKEKGLRRQDSVVLIDFVGGEGVINVFFPIPLYVQYFLVIVSFFFPFMFL